MATPANRAGRSSEPYAARTWTPTWHPKPPQIRRAQVRVNAKERKLRTRRLILLGSYLDDIIQNDPVSMKRVRKGLDEFLERDRDRALFDLAPRPPAEDSK